MRKALLGIIFVAGVSLALGEEPEYFPRNDFNDCKNYYGGIRDSDIKNLNLRKQRMGVKMPRAYYNNEKKKFLKIMI